MAENFSEVFWNNEYESVDNSPLYEGNLDLPLFDLNLSALDGLSQDNQSECLLGTEYLPENLDCSFLNNLSIPNNFSESGAAPVPDNSHFNNLSIQNSFREREAVPVGLIEANNVPQPVVSVVSHAPSSLPASQNWPGEYNFNVSFSQEEKSTKGVSWTYSKVIDKLYVGKDAPCPINFSTNTLMPENVKIRAMALYSSPESASEVVVRCVNHSLEEKSKNVLEAEHLVRCLSTNASYEVDPSTRHHSVVVPFENPPAGQLFSSYIFKFTCFGSCRFGPNRRPLMLVFTLERGNQVLGRWRVDVKICACPGRDRKSDEQQAAAHETCSSKKRKEPEFETMEFTKNVRNPVPKKAKHAQNSGRIHYIRAEPECAQFLMQMKRYFEYCKLVNFRLPDMKKVLAQYQSSEDSSSDA